MNELRTRAELEKDSKYFYDENRPEIHFIVCEIKANHSLHWLYKVWKLRPTSVNYLNVLCFKS